MSLPEIASPEEWRAARVALLAEEKELTRRRDAISEQRRRLPMVEVTKDYRFTGPDGELSLRDLFGDYRQLILDHFMFDPEWEQGCPSCTAGTDEIAPGLYDHLHHRDTEYVHVSRAPIEKLEAYKAARGWDFMRWYSSHGSDFNYDFGVTVDAEKAAPVYNFRAIEEGGEYPGTSVFLRVEDRVFHTYSSYGRGAEWTGGGYAFLDLTALGRQEDWEQPAGRADAARAGKPIFED